MHGNFRARTRRPAPRRPYRRGERLGVVERCSRPGHRASWLITGATHRAALRLTVPADVSDWSAPVHPYRRSVVSKLACAACGHVIFDQSDYLPYKAELVKDQDAFEVWTDLESDLAGYVRTVRLGSEGARRAWIAAHLPESVPADATDEQVVSGLVLR